MWQEIAIICVGILTLAYVGWKIYRFISTSGNASSGACGGCTGCSLHQVKKHNSCCH